MDQLLVPRDPKLLFGGNAMKMPFFLLFLFFQLISYDANASAASRLLSRAIAPIKVFTSAHPRLAKTAVVGAAVVGAYALYKWWQKTKIDKRNLQASVSVDPAKYNEEVAKVLLDVSPGMPCEIIKEINSYIYTGFEGTCSSYISEENANFLVVFSDAKFASAYGNVIKIWDVRTKKCLKTLAGHTGQIKGLVTDGVNIISGSLDKTFKIWDITSGDCLCSFKRDNAITALALLKNKRFAVGLADGTVEIMSLETREKLLSWQNNGSLVKNLVELRGNNILVTYGYDFPFEVRDYHEGKLVQILSGRVYRDRPIVYRNRPILGGIPRRFHDFQELVMVRYEGGDGGAQITLVSPKGLPTSLAEGHFGVDQLAFLPDGTLLSVSLSDFENALFKVWNLDKCIKTVRWQQFFNFEKDRNYGDVAMSRKDNPLEHELFLEAFSRPTIAVMPNGTVIMGTRNRIYFCV